MQCRYFRNGEGQCADLAQYPFACCDNVHGYRFKQDKAQAERYLAGEIPRSALADGMTDWTTEKLEYMSKVIRELTPKE